MTPPRRDTILTPMSCSLSVSYTHLDVYKRQELSADYEAEQAELKKRAAALQAELDKSQAATVNAEKFMGLSLIHI